MTRPTRRLRTIIEAMPIFKEVAEGEEWSREIQKKFEDALASSNVKTDGATRSDSGGKRTWAVYPRIFGLWYEEDGIVKTTQAAERIIAGENEAVKQVRHQILRFQWPNRTQDHRSQKMDVGFKIFPYRFIIKLLLDERIKYLLTSEIALFILQVKTEDELENTIKSIIKYRKQKEKDGITLSDRTELIENNKKLRPSKDSDQQYSSENHYKYLTDLANTFMNHLDFFEEINHEKSAENREWQIAIDDGRQKELKNLISEYDKKFPLSLLYKHPEAKWFIENYGNAYYNTKASRKSSKPKGKKEKDTALVEATGNKILREETSVGLRELVSEISKRTGMSQLQIAKIVSLNSKKFGWEKNRNSFEKRYLEISGNGKMNIEFEDMTRKIFQSFGFPTEKLTYTTQTGNQLVIDGFVQKKPNSGIIDAKSGKKFACGNKEVGIMKDYIKNFKEYEHKGDKFCIIFFAYVYGKEFANDGNFKRIISESGVSGARISAIELIKLKEKFDSKEISKEQIWKLFQKNGEITAFNY